MREWSGRLVNSTTLDLVVFSMKDVEFLRGGGRKGERFDGKRSSERAIVLYQNVLSHWSENLVLLRSQERGM